MLVQPQAWRSTRKHTGERGLPHVERVAPQVVAVELDQVKGIEKHAVVVTVVPDAIKGCDPIVTAGHRLPINDAGLRAQPGERLDDQGETVGQVIARPAVEPACRPCGRSPGFVQRLAGRRVRG
jgi:hypothetical protein